MRRSLLLCLVLIGVLLAGCGRAEPFCPRPAGTPHYLAGAPELLPTPRPAAGPVEVEIGGEMVAVDRVVEGPLCNDSWSGTVYVTCAVQVYPWEGQPTFLKECNLTIEPGTVVYVADHRNEPFYKGCSCHEGPGGN